MSEQNKTIVNSWNEWDPLKHVIVGVADGTHIPPAEPALDAKVPEDSDMKGDWGPRSEESVFKANEQLDNFVKILENRGIKVDRPTPIDFSQKVVTPDFIRSVIISSDCVAGPIVATIFVLLFKSIFDIYK